MAAFLLAPRGALADTAEGTPQSQPAYDKAAPLAALSDDVRNSSNSQSAQSDIKQFVDTALGNLQINNPDAQADARQKLLDAARPPTSSTFQYLLAGDLNEGAIKVLDGKNWHAKLNVAIVVAGVGAETGSAQLARVANKLMQAKSIGLELWGVKCGGAILPGVLELPAQARDIDQAKLLDTIAATGVKNVDSIAVTAEAYKALNFNLSALQFPTQAQFKELIPAMLRLVGARAKHYADGSVKGPSADYVGVVFLTVAAAFNKAMTDAQRTQTLKLIQAISAGAAAMLLNGPDRQLRDQLTQIIKTVGSGLFYLSDSPGITHVTKLQRDAKTLKEIAVGVTPAQTISDDVKALNDDIDAILSGASEPKP